MWSDYTTVGGISIHALVKRATNCSALEVTCESNFNPRPREEGDSERMRTYVSGAISIHALVKRATRLLQTRLSSHGISIHALVKRATNILKVCGICGCDFNPRPREEGDRIVNIVHTAAVHFNPRPREEGDDTRSCTFTISSVFQSTPS